jgi:glycerol uptake facilitator-like aquaporin
MLRRLAAEFLGSALLTALVVGSGIAAQRLSPTDTGLQLLENAFATALGLPVLILIFASVSGAHFNPAVSLADAALGHRSWRDLVGYVPAQIAGCLGGAVLANAMFGATAGLVLVIFALARRELTAVIPWAVGAYIGAAYFFTSSSSFANPAITIGRMITDTFAGIAPASAPWFIAAQLVGALLAVALVRWMFPVTATSRIAADRE